MQRLDLETHCTVGIKRVLPELNPFLFLSHLTLVKFISSRLRINTAITHGANFSPRRTVMSLAGTDKGPQRVFGKHIGSPVTFNNVSHGPVPLHTYCYYTPPPARNGWRPNAITGELANRVSSVKLETD